MALVVTLSLAAAQHSAVQPDVMILHAQLKGIADELAEDFTVDRGQRFVVHVESTQHKTVLENILLEVLKSRGAEARLLTGGGMAGDSVLRVVILGQQTSLDQAANGTTVRNAETIVDARIETSDGDVPAQRVFRRSFADTLAADTRAAEMTLFERLLEPAIVILGAVLVVYLLFTVRSS